MNTLSALDMRLIISDANFAIEMLAAETDASRRVALEYMERVRAELMRAAVAPVVVEVAA